MKTSSKSGRFISSVRVGPKGQIIIPKEIRDIFGIEPGDTLVMLADKEKGIAIQRSSFFSKIADKIFEGKAKELYPDQSEEDSRAFAGALRDVDGKDDSGIEDDGNDGDKN